MANRVVWLDIPVKDLDRAIRFYSEVLGEKVHKEEFPGMAIGVLPHEKDGVGGCLFVKEGEEPSDHGPLVYLSVEGRLDAALEAVAKGGGKVLQARHPIGPYGHRAVVLDSEGNRVALHSMK